MKMDFLLIESSPLGGRSGHEAGRELLAALYRRQFGTQMPEITVTPMGKPYFVDKSAHFSISHTKNRVFCALSSRNVAIDAEEIDRKVSENLAKKILSPREYAQYEAAADKPQAILKFWVLKEAAGKLSGKGVQPYPNHTDFSLEDPRITQLHGHFVAVLTEQPNT